MTNEEILSVFDMMRRLEWKWNASGSKECPVCYEGMKYGHSKDCELKRCIELLEKKATE